MVAHPACAETLARLSLALGVDRETALSGAADSGDGMMLDQQRVQQAVGERMHRQVKEIERATAADVSLSEQRRNAITWHPLAQVETVAEAAPLIASNSERLWRVLGKVEGAKRLALARKYTGDPHHKSQVDVSRGRLLCCESLNRSH